MLVQAGGGLAGGVIGGIGVGLTGALIGKAVGPRGNWGAPLAGGVIGVALGLVGGIPVGVQLTGDARDGTGRGWGTAAGTVLATGTGIAVALATETTGGYIVTKAVGFVVLVLGTSILGYHVSADDHAPMTVPLTLRF